MKKPWSITTTLRNPERLRNFLIVLKQLENHTWSSETQKEYQILLIQNRIYGYGRSQFYKNLRREQVTLINNVSQNISFAQAEEIFNTKRYIDSAMRGRQSLNPLKKLGFVAIEHGKLKITDLGNLLLEENFDFGELFFRSFLKWQIPNPNSYRSYPPNGVYNIKPFMGTLHLINSVNQKEILRGKKRKGISKEEFSLFCPTLIHYDLIEKYADEIITLRNKLVKKTKDEQRVIFNDYRDKFARDFFNVSNKNEIDTLLKNLQDYGDNAIRYFRLTRYLYIRGHGFYVDLEPRREVEINSLLAYDNAQIREFVSKKEYLSYISDIAQPHLPWETREKYCEITEFLISEIHQYEKSLGKKRTVVKALKSMQTGELKGYIATLRTFRRQLQEEENSRKSQSIEKIQSYIESFKNIERSDNRPVLLEQLSTLGLYALNDALKIQPNYPVGDDNQPTFTAPANTPDIECFYKNFNAICEVTMLRGRDQWYNEGQPVMRHLRDFEEKNRDKPSYCLFIAPSLHRDTVNTFWVAIKYEYEGKLQKIIPLTISEFVLILKILLQMKKDEKVLKHSEISRLYDEILQSSQLYKNAQEWVKSISETISTWGNSVTQS